MACTLRTLPIAALFAWTFDRALRIHHGFSIDCADLLAAEEPVLGRSLRRRGRR